MEVYGIRREGGISAVILVSGKVGSTIECGCAIRCRDRFGDTLQIVTSGFVSCGCVNDGIGGSSNVEITGNPNGVFNVVWDSFFSFWRAVLSTTTTRQYLDEDCMTLNAESSTELAVIVACTGNNVMSIEGVGFVLNQSPALFDVPYSSTTCGSGANVGNGVITLLNPE